MSARDCIRAIEEAAGGRLSDSEVEELIEELNRRAEARKAAGAQESLEDILFDEADMLASDAVAAAQIERRNRFMNIRIKADLIRFADQLDAETGDPSLALSARMVGINKFIPGARKSVDARGSALMQDYMGGMIADLRKDNLLPFLNSRELELEIAQELAELSKRQGEPGISGSKEARGIAEAIHKYRRLAVQRENRAGAWIRPLEGYVVRQSHDMHKMRRAGFEEWRNFLIENRLLDEAATFNGADPSAFLKSAYDGLTTGVHIKSNGGDESDLTLAFKGPGNLAKRVSQHRVIHFKDAAAWHTYNQRFGRGTLMEAVFHEFERAGRNTAMMETFGPNPRAMFDTVKDELKERFRDPKKVDRLDRRSLENQFRAIDGTTRIPVNTTAATVTANVMAVESMAKLGGATLSAITDLGFKATTLLQDGNILQAWGRTIESSLDGLSGGDKRIAAELIGVGLDGQIGHVASRWTAQDDVAGALSKMQQKFFKVNLLGPWTDANKRGLGLMWSRELAMQKSVSFADIPQRDLLSFYGMDEAKWDIARRAIRTADDGREYLFPDAIRDLPDEAFGDATPRQISRIKDDVETTLRSYFADRAEEAVPTPGARERAILQQGHQPGTPSGVAVRLVMQFKAFPVTVLTRQLGRASGADSIGEFFRSIASGKADSRALAHMIIATTVLGYGAMVAKDLAKGRTPRDPTQWNTWQAAMMQGGGMGIYGDFLLGETNRFGRSALDTLAGPTLGSISDLDELRAKAMAGEDTAASAIRFITSNTPFANLFYTRAALDHLILFEFQEAVNPGYLRRMERRIRRENNQEFFISPGG